MLINIHKLNFLEDPMLMVLSTAAAGGFSRKPERVSIGIYLIHHFNMNHILPGGCGTNYGRKDVEEVKADWLGNPVLGEEKIFPSGEKSGFGDYGEYGVCDSPEQFLETDLGLWIAAEPNRKFLVSMARINKSEQSPQGGWRWHKWGEYIGLKEPQYEYIYDEGDDIESVCCFSVYECLNPRWMWTGSPECC